MYEVLVEKRNGDLALDTPGLSLKEAKERRRWLVYYEGWEPSRVFVQEELDR
jgi:hypothetical protein